MGQLLAKKVTKDLLLLELEMVRGVRLTLSSGPGHALYKPATQDSVWLKGAEERTLLPLLLNVWELACPAEFTWPVAAFHGFNLVSAVTVVILHILAVET